MKYTRARLHVVQDILQDLPSKEFPEPDLKIENNQIFIKRPWLGHLLANRGPGEMEKLKKNAQLSEQQRQERRERHRQMEAERKKALRATMLRAKQLKRKNKLSILEEDSTFSQVSFCLIFFQ
jgi:hypothetical protein